MPLFLRPSERLTTQNLIISAASALEGKSARWQYVHDLCTFVDIFCMYDSLSVLGRAARYTPPSLRPALNSGIVKVAEISHPLARRVQASAQKHLDAYLGDLAEGRTAVAVERALTHGIALHELSRAPDGPPDGFDFQEPDNGKVKQHVARALRSHEQHPMFILRSFIYTAYADVAGVVFVPDVARMFMMNSIADSEFELRAKLLEAMKKGDNKYRGPQNSPLRRVSALAGVLFERTGYRRERMVPELLKLRQELAPLRAKLQEAETRMLYGKGAQTEDVKADWKLVTKEIERKYGDEPHLISVNGVLSFGREAAELSDEPHKAKNWVNILLGLPFDIARRVLSRKPAIEIHRLHKEQPGAGRLMNAIAQMFGPLN